MRTILILLALAALAGFPQQASADIMLGTAGDFAVLAGTTVTNTGSSVITAGHVGVRPGSAITGFPPGIVVPPFTMHATDGVALQAQSSATLGASTQFEGHILALTSITLNTGATILEGSALARNGALTLDDNRITSCSDSPTAVEATSWGSVKSLYR
jgi:hypothetical protein